jgi:hypothetical protein
VETQAYLELNRDVVAREDGVLVLAWVRVQLPAIDLDGLKYEGAIRVLLVAAVLPLDYAFGAPGFLRC